jgi:hypothetical protein
MKYDNNSSKWVVDNDLKVKTQNLSTAGKIAYTNVTGTPTIGSGVLNIMQNGLSAFYPGNSFNANSTTGGTANIETDQWKVTTATVTNGQFTFTGLDDTQGYAYHPYVEITDSSTELNPYAKISTLTGAGTSNMSITYDTNADNGSTVKLRIVK